MTTFTASVGRAVTSAGGGRQLRGAGDVGTSRQAEIEGILAALERKSADPAVRARAAAKLPTLSDRQLRLLASLSERVAADGDGPAGGIALFLITALLILS